VLSRVLMCRMGRWQAGLQLAMSGGGAANHEHDVRPLQTLRAAAVRLWGAALARRGGGRGGPERGLPLV
jgi:hypothetical protein